MNENFEFKTSDAESDVEGDVKELSVEQHEELESLPSNLEQSEAFLNGLHKSVDEHIAQLETEIDIVEEASGEQHEEARSILEQFRQLASKEVRAFALTAVLFLPAVAHGAEVDEQLNESEGVEQVVENYETAVQNRIKLLREGVWTDNHESMYVLYGQAHDMRELSVIQGEDGAIFMSSTDEEDTIMDHRRLEIDKKSTGGKMISTSLHNHPPQVLKNDYSISDEQILSMKNGTAPMLIAPPSIIDVIGASLTNDSSVDTVDYTIEPSGVWKYDPDEYNADIITYNEIVDEYEKDIAKYNIDGNAGMSEGMNNNSLLQEEMIQKIYNRLSYQFNISLMNLMEIAHEIRTVSLDGGETNGLIQAYIKSAEDMGVKVTYTSNAGEVYSAQEKAGAIGVGVLDELE